MIKVYEIRPNQTVLDKCEVVMIIKQLYTIFYTSYSTKQLKLMQLTFGNGLENFTPCLAWELC